MKKLIFNTFLFLLMLGGGCSTITTNTITQTSTIDALLAGTYDGTISCGRRRISYV